MRTRVCSKRPDKLHVRQVVYAIRLGTFNRHHRSSQDTIAFAYKEVKMLGREEDEIPNLDVVRDRLLVPSSVTSKGSEYPVEGIEPRIFQHLPLEIASLYSFNKNYHMKQRANNYLISKKVIS